MILLQLNICNSLTTIGILPLQHFFTNHFLQTDPKEIIKTFLMEAFDHNCKNSYLEVEFSKYETAEGCWQQKLSQLSVALAMC